MDDPEPAAEIVIDNFKRSAATDTDQLEGILKDSFELKAISQDPNNVTVVL